MNPSPRVTAVVPVKGSSDRVENKNTRLLDGKPLFLHTLEKLVRIPCIDRVVLDTESDAIAALAEHVDCQRLQRDPALASNRTDGNRLLLNEIEHLEGDIFVQVLCTSPFLEEVSIARAVETLLDSDAHDSVVAVHRQKQYTWDGRKGWPTYDIAHIPNSVDLDDTIVETMGLYAIRREAALATGRRIGERPFLLELSPLEAVDVNYPEDLALAQAIAAGRREDETRRLRMLTQHLSSTIISDVLDGLGKQDCVVSGLAPNRPGLKVFGRAKTLKICASDSPVRQSDIYGAYQSYRTIRPGDLIVVETAVPEFAYFGFLNANLAIRCGAAGAIIGGHTRDAADVEAMNFPVFSAGYTCRDVKERGAVEAINRRIHLDGVRVDYESLVYADQDGIVVIPRDSEEAVLGRCREVVAQEMGVLADIRLDRNIDAILTRHGEF